ncbi:MAG: type II toxin-antitoxin system RelE/ParE family toxin [Magnetococcales bacterium]|nr:type II toxin-antitoxin system RelE/ParE family toxin [Magnetococcales bacterium]MBF0148256.1 type II toxin-antitoxin system RelE/ParE family toxin [Magnetococcales bacterium]MBF0152090.1 type II toxin-antitoxin system RelE/ParE family toxin [Magnetococcales bacterium]
MNAIIQSPTFSMWLSSLKDLRGRTAILRRLIRAERGNLGDVRPVDGGVFEMRVDYGPGYRLYFVRRGGTVIILLCGGDKSTQRRDIVLAQTMAKEV